MAVRNTGFQSQWSPESLNDCTGLPWRKWRSIRAKLPVRARSEVVTVTGHLLCSLLGPTGQLSEPHSDRCSLLCPGFPINQAARQMTRVWQALQALAGCTIRRRWVFWEGLAEVIRLPGWVFFANRSLSIHIWECCHCSYVSLTLKEAETSRFSRQLVLGSRRAE